MEEGDYQEILTLAKRFYDMGLALYATGGTAEAIRSLGLTVYAVKNASESDEIMRLMDSGEVCYVIYTGAVKDATVGDYTALHRRAMRLGIPCLTSLDTANALADSMESRFTRQNVELIDINHMRPWRQKIRFAKMHTCGNDYIFIENFDGRLTCPESLCVDLCDPRTGIGGNGVVLMERSAAADVRMRSFNRDGSESRIAGNNIRCVAKYVYDKGYVRSESMTVETADGVRQLKLYLRDGKANSVTVNMGYAAVGKAQADGSVPVSLGGEHRIVFCDAIDSLDLRNYAGETDTEFVRVIDPLTVRMRSWERGSGETLAYGAGTCASVAAAVNCGLCPAGRDVAVKFSGGDVTVNVTDERVLLTGNAVLSYEGEFEY